MTEPLTFTDLTPELVEELTPPCEMCRALAGWAYRFQCGRCGHVGVWLLCDPHKVTIDQELDRMQCGECYRRGRPRVRAERI